MCGTSPSLSLPQNLLAVDDWRMKCDLEKNRNTPQTTVRFLKEGYLDN